MGIRDEIPDVSLYSHLTMKDKPEEGNCDGRLVVLDEAYHIIRFTGITWDFSNFRWPVSDFNPYWNYLGQ